MSTQIPSHRQMLWPTLRAVAALGGSGRISEIDEAAMAEGGFTEEQQSVIHGAGPRTELEYRMAWARTHLKLIGALENSSRGVWSLTERGREVVEAGEAAVVASYSDYLRTRQKPAVQPDTDDQLALEEARDWKEELLQALLDLEPDRFERLCRRLLREAGFTSVTVTGQSGDGGIDGLGVYRLSLVSFPVFFQCKRYRGSVRAGAVRDFRGAMAGRGDKGLLITTGTFTAEAKREANRDGAPPIDLIDGEQLCDLLKEYGLGVVTRQRQVEEVEVDASIFEDV
ncbi:MAG: restriction endonuclease [Gaiellaceae bacterium]